MPEITVNVTPQFDLPNITFDFEQDAVKVIENVRRTLPDGTVWDTKEYTFWETIPAEQTQPVYDPETGEQTGTEAIPNPDTWYQLPAAYAQGARDLYTYLISELQAREDAEIAAKATK
jgi:sugar lactone lactonase YvrE